MSGARMSPYELEGLFIEKLTQKYKLNERDIKRAFAHCDADGNGLLSLQELTGAFERYLNGVDRRSIEELISRYDVNGDGLIGFEEFYELLTRRDSSKAPHPRSDPRNSKASRKPKEEVPSEFHLARPQHARRGPTNLLRDGHHRDDPDPASFEDNNGGSHRYHQERPAGPPGKGRHRSSTDDFSEVSLPEDEYSTDRYRYHQERPAAPPARGQHRSSTDDYSEVSNLSDIESDLSDARSEASDYHSEMPSEFDPNSASDMESRVKVFMHNLKSYLLREAQQLRKEERVANRILVHANELSENVGRALILRAFERVSQTVGRDLVNFKSFQRVLKSFPLPGLPNVRMEVYQYLFSLCCSEEEPNMVDPNAFVGLLFGSSNPTRQRVSEQIYHRRSTVGHGPVLDKTGGQALPNEVSLADVKEKYVCSKSRTTYQKPTNFTVEDLQASATEPACTVTRNHLFGLRVSELYSGKALHCLQSHPGDKAQRYVVYAASSLGVVHDVASNTQVFFDGHSDEITCISVDPTSTFVVTGQLGRDPALHVWEARTGKAVKRLGKGFFQRAVCAACFSHDTKYVCGISADDRHSLGIWDVNTNQLVCETTSANGIPPQVRSLTWAPATQMGAHISREHHGLGDVFVTTGERHLKFWSFQRPQGNSGQGALAFKGGSMGVRKKATASSSTNVRPPSRGRARDGVSASVSVDQAKIYYCSEFILRGSSRETPRPLEKGNEYNVVTGGDNGYVYMWEYCVCIANVRASRGAIKTIKVVGENIFVGCVEAVVKLFDSSLQLLGEYSAVLDDSITGDLRPPSARAKIMDSGKGNRAVGRPKSANRAVRGGGVATAVQAVARMRLKGGARDDSERPSTASSGASNAAHAQAKINAILAMDMDFKPFFYSGAGRGEAGETLVVASANGTCMRLHISSRSMEPPTRLFSFHMGELWGLGSTGSLGKIFVTGGDDRLLCVWSIEKMDLLGRRRVQAAAKCCCFDKSSQFIAVGMARGFFSVHFFDYRDGEVESIISEALVSRHDCVEDISDIKFNPSSTQLAVGSHDNYIDIYDVELRPPSRSSTTAYARAHPAKRLRGHTSYVTHLDWSLDGRIIQSTCGAYELLYWDVETGRQFSYTTGWNPSDVQWKMYTCILGFPVMGIWPLYADGTDINSLHVSRDRSLVATADDSGMLNLFNYPCVVKNAPRKSFNGHSSHVTNVRFMYDDRVIVTVGGNDKCVIVWNVDKVKIGKPLPAERGWR